LTVIIIAHRLSTIKDADKIVVIKQGVKEEEGNHQYLVDNYPDGIYNHLVKLDAATSKPLEQEEMDDDDLDNSPTPELNKKSSLRKASSIKHSKVEETKLEIADAEDEKYDKALEEEIANKPSTTWRFFSMMRPGWVLPVNTLITVLLAPSTMIRAYLIFDRMILLFLPIE
jgi:ABC-type glutathione transport system ATPase component